MGLIKDISKKYKKTTKKASKSYTGETIKEAGELFAGVADYAAEVEKSKKKKSSGFGAFGPPEW